MKYYWFATRRSRRRPRARSRAPATRARTAIEVFVAAGSRPSACGMRSSRRASRPASCPAGLGARDTLRLEAAMRLYGNDMDEHDDGARGGPRMDRRLEEGRLHRRGRPAPPEGGRRPRGSWSASRCSIAGSRRHGYDVYVDGAKAGVVTSGTQTPFLKKAIGMAYVPVEHTASGHRVRGRRPRPPRARGRRPDAVLQAGK